MKKYSQIFKMSSEELDKKESEIRKDLIDMTKSLRAGDMQNHHTPRYKRKELARVLTAKKLITLSASTTKPAKITKETK